MIAEAEQTLDTDAKLAASIKKAGNVLLPSVYVLGEPQGKADQPLKPQQNDRPEVAARK